MCIKYSYSVFKLLTTVELTNFCPFYDREKLNINTRSNPNAAPGNESNNQGFTELIAELRTLQVLRIKTISA